MQGALGLPGSSVGKQNCPRMVAQGKDRLQEESMLRLISDR